jgi:CHAT domain-containing protein/tetratricopeptide (TPR) repeat protein
MKIVSHRRTIEVGGVPLEAVRKPLPEAVGELERLARSGRADEAHALALVLLEQVESAAMVTVADADAANQLGMFFSNRFFDVEARRALTRALEGLLGTGQKDNVLLAGIHNNLGQLDERAGELESAQDHLEKALLLQRGASGHPVAVAYTEDNLGAVLMGRGLLDRAEGLQQQALATLQKAGPKYRDDVATVLGNLGVLYRKRGDASRARACLLRALDLHLQVAPLETGNARVPLVNLVGLLLETGDDASADELVDMLLRVGGSRIGAAHHPIAVALSSLAKQAFASFRLGLAERLATRALALLEVTAGGAAEPALQMVQLLANVHSAKGNHEAAERGLLRALETTRADPQKSAELMIDFGKALRARGKGAEQAAASMFERAIAHLRARGNPSMPAELQLLGSALGNLALLHFDLDDSPRADALYGEALALGSRQALGNEYPWLVYSRALLHYHLERYDEARDGMRRALRLWTRQRGTAHPFVATALANLALVHWATGDRVAAQRAFDRAARAQAPELQRMLLVGTERERLEAARQTQGDLFKRISFCFDAGARAAVARGAAQILLQRKAAVLDALALTHTRIREQLDSVSRERFDQLAELRQRMSSKALGASLFGTLADPSEVSAWQVEEERLQSELSHAGALGLVGLQPVTLQAVRATLSAGAVLLELVRWSVFDPQRTGRGIPWRGERYAAMVLRPRGEPQWFDVGDAAEVDAAVARLRELLRDPDSDTADVDAAAAELNRRLITPCEGLLVGCRLLHVAPDGELNLLPFGVLGPIGGPKLVERFTLNHVGSGRDLMREPQACSPGTEVHAFVDADFDAGARAGAGLRLQPLPGTRREAAVLQAHFTHCIVHAGAAACVAAVKALHRPALVHIATHGVFAPPSGAPRPLWRTDTISLSGELVFLQSAGPAAIDNPMLSVGLALAGANASVPGRPAGFISAAELAGVDLRGTEVVVLSACETGLGVAAYGDEFAGLRRAFTIAGAQSQVISLWAVDDDAAAALMGEYYDRLVAGQGRAEALAKAQQAVRDRPRFAHPNVWAAFAAWGQAGPLSNVLRQSASVPR